MIVINALEKKAEPFSKRNASSSSSVSHVFLPGEKISADLTGFMRGHGTHTTLKKSVNNNAANGEQSEGTEMLDTKADANLSRPNSELCASLGGRLQIINKLLTIEPPKFRYVGHIGDCVVGRVVALGQKRWLIDTNSRLLSVLLLSAVNLPGGELRRKSEEDERAMRAWLREGDVISAEVQNVYQDGSLALHARSLRYGKVGSPPSEGGVLLTVPPALVRRAKTHFHTLPCGTSIIIGNNGLVWVEPAPVKRANDSMTSDDPDVWKRTPSYVTARESAARVRNCILALAGSGLPLYASSIVAAVEYCTERCPSASELLLPSVSSELVETVAGKLDAGLI